MQLGDDQWKCDQGTSESISYTEKSPLSKETKTLKKGHNYEEVQKNDGFITCHDNGAEHGHHRVCGTG